jgi:AcrR family transcriptional regulator
MKKRNSKNSNTASRRKEIIQAAMACFTERSFSETSLADIRRRSKASTGSIYHHFKSKEQLAAQVYLEGIHDYQAGFLATLEKQQRARSGIVAVIEYHLRWVEGHPDWARFLFQKRRAEFMDTTKDAFDRLNKEFMGRAAAWFRRHIKAGSLRPLAPDIFISILLGPCQEFSRQYLSGYARSALDQAIDELARAAWRTLGMRHYLR